MPRTLTLSILLLALPAHAEDAAPEPIRVRVVDAASGQPVPLARCQIIRGGDAQVSADGEGLCVLDVESGRYELRVSADFYRSRRVAVPLQRGGPRVTIQLREDPATVEEVLVVEKPDTSTEAVQIVRRQKAASVSDAISAEQMARTPDSSAGDAVKRVVAATVQDGKYIIIRGLGGRYTSTLLNGVNLPSPDPDNPAAPLDLFPAALLANLTVTKTFNPDIPGNFAGGSLSIETREFPSDFTLKLRASTSLDTVTTFRDTASSTGGSLDFLGFDDGARALPDAVPDKRVSRESELPEEQLQGIARSFNNNWKVEHVAASPSLGLGGTIGDTLERDGTRFGYLGSVTYGNRWTRRAQESRTILNESTPSLEYEVHQGMHSTSLGGLVNLGFSPSADQRFGGIAFYSHSSEDSASIADGVTAPGGAFVERTRLRFVERSLAFGQLSGEHDLAAHRLTLAWQGNLSLVTQAEPDVRDLNYIRLDGGEMRFDPGPGSGNRTYVDLGDLSGGGGASVTLSLEPLKLKVGGAAQLTSRELAARRFNFSRAPGVAIDDARLLEPADQLFTADNMGPLLQISESTRSGDGYEFTRNVYAGYAMIDLLALAPLRLVAGARVEVADQELRDSTKYLSGSAMNAAPIERSDVDVLPAVNGILALGKAQSLRASYSATVARPHVREIAPFKFNDYTRGRVLEGNPEVRTTTVHNVDLRFERFFAGPHLAAVSLFYKRFIDPIEAVINANNDVTYQNALHADSYGAELEARLPLPWNLRLGANLSLIRSTVEFDARQGAAQTSKSRALQGQSPYVGNVELGWSIPRTKSDFTALYNVLGRRITEAGTNEAPDTYEQAFHRLDLTYSQRLPASLLLKLSGTNLLDQRVQMKQGQVEVLGYDPGVAFILSMEWSQ